eukprot:209292-Pelagomonas_calceolata.AAC.6
MEGTSHGSVCSIAALAPQNPCHHRPYTPVGCLSACTCGMTRRSWVASGSCQAAHVAACVRQQRSRIQGRRRHSAYIAASAWNEVPSHTRAAIMQAHNSPGHLLHQLLPVP